MFFLMSLYIQNILQYSPLMTGLAFLPFPIILGSLSQRMARGVSRFGYRPFLIAGPLLTAIGIAWLTRLPVHGSYVHDILPNVILMPIGMAMTFMPLIVAATSGVRESESGLAAGLINTSQQMGGALGLAILSSVAASSAASHASLGPLEAIVFGYDRAFLTGVLFIIVGTILGLLIIPQKNSSASIHVQGQSHGM